MVKDWLTILLLLTSLTYASAQDGFVEGNPRIAYWQVGRKSQIVIVLHGGPSVQHKYLRPEFDALRKVAKVIYYDQRGCGRSERAASYLWQHHVSDLKRVIQAVSGDKKVFLAGSSWGSTLALVYAYTYPDDVKGLILTGTYQWGGVGGTYQRKLRYKAYPPHKQTLAEEQLYTDTTDDGSINEQSRTITKEIEVYGGTSKEEPVESFVTAPVADSLHQVNVPVLIFNGSRDCGIDWGHKYVNLLPKAELYTIPGACHDPWFSNPALFFTICEDFIRYPELKSELHHLTRTNRK